MVDGCSSIVGALSERRRRMAQREPSPHLGPDVGSVKAASEELELGRGTGQYRVAHRYPTDSDGRSTNAESTQEGKGGDTRGRVRNPTGPVYCTARGHGMGPRDRELGRQGKARSRKEFVKRRELI